MIIAGSDKVTDGDTQVGTGENMTDIATEKTATEETEMKMHMTGNTGRKHPEVAKVNNYGLMQTPCRTATMTREVQGFAR